MTKKKYYAVRQGKAPGIYQTWDECEAQVKGFPGAVFKSFELFSDAENFLAGNDEKEGGKQDLGGTKKTQTEKNDIEESKKNEKKILTEKFNSMVEKRIAELHEDEAIAFVDGSYDNEKKKSAFGAIILCAGGRREEMQGAFSIESDGEEFISIRNVAAELEGAKAAINWGIANRKKNITIFYDYAGIEKWATRAWKANNEITKNYVEFIKEKRKEININFEKVAAHTGIALNEEVDMLAKSALAEK